MLAAALQTMVEQCQQMLECQKVYVLPMSFEMSTRHPLLTILPEGAFPAVSFPAREASEAEIWQEERIQAFCDLALQSGRMQLIDSVERSMAGQQLCSVAAVPLESSSGMLGVLLLLDERCNQFGLGEERLLYAYLSMYVLRLEVLLWEEVHSAVLTLSPAATGGAGDLPSQFVRSEFVSMVGHELRAPLGVIKGYAGLLQLYGGGDGRQEAAVLTPQQQRHYVDAIMEQTTLLEVLVNDLLDISRIQQGKLVLRPRRVDIGELCLQVVRRSQVRADQVAAGKYQLICILSKESALVWADADRLQQILMNLLDNAIKYSPDGGRIELEVCIARGNSNHLGGSARVVISIRDQGMGMAQTGGLFQPFVRREQVATARIPGMGLGLYITRRLVEAMHGKIDLQSCEGRGTNVTIQLPAVGLEVDAAPEALSEVLSLLPE